MPDLSGQVILVTGGATGIGRGISQALSDSGARVAILQPSLEQAWQGASAIPGAIGFAADVRLLEQVEQAVLSIIASMGRIDGLVNNAALTGAAVLGPLHAMSPDRVRAVIDTNLTGSIWCVQSVVKQLIQQGEPGAIVNISSVGAFAAQDQAAVYCATKGALVALTRAMALELAAYRIRVNAVAPGDIGTGTNADVVAEMKDRGVSADFIRKTPMGRRGTPAEIGKVVAFLMSSDASFITGETTVVDGGFMTY